MDSRQRIVMALDHREPDRVPLDLGASPVEPYQMLGEVKPDLMAALGVDVIGLGSSVTMFGFRNEGWKPWTTFDGTPVLVPEGFNTEPEANGDILMLHIQRIHPVHAHLVYP
jgi:hypothetical protein